MCVSTAMVGWPKTVLSTTFAVFRPTPGSASSAARSAGTLPPWRSTSARLSAITFLAFVLKSPMVLMCSLRRASPSASMSAGVSTAAKSAPVALLTPLSVACAESTTATSSV